jgi:hypothetical protein
MPSEELMERVRTLRGQGRSPKEIARALRLSPSTVAPLVRAVAAEGKADAPEPVIAGCLVSPGGPAGSRFMVGWGGPASMTPAMLDQSGLVTLLVARGRGGGKVSCRRRGSVFGHGTAQDRQVRAAVSAARRRGGVFATRGRAWWVRLAVMPSFRHAHPWAGTGSVLSEWPSGLDRFIIISLCTILPCSCGNG